MQDVTDQEILSTLKSMLVDKSPGLDGFPVEFFTGQWNIIKNDVLKVVHEFFMTGKILKSFSCTTVTLIPKYANPTMVKDYRPIVCCKPSINW